MKRATFLIVAFALFAVFGISARADGGAADIAKRFEQLLLQGDWVKTKIAADQLSDPGIDGAKIEAEIDRLSAALNPRSPQHSQGTSTRY